MRVLHAPVNVGNQPWSLSRAERELGLASDLVVHHSTWPGYPADRVLGRPGEPAVFQAARRLLWGATAPFRYDVLHYYFGRSLLSWKDHGPDTGWPLLDLRLAKRFGRKVFLTLQGCDVRLAGESGRRNVVTMCREEGCSQYATCLASTDARRRKFIDAMVPLADRTFVLNPELAHYVPAATFLPYANVAVESMRPRPSTRRERPLVLHAPSDPSIKGTSLIEASLKALQKEYAFQYVAVRGETHERAMALYGQADILIDQVLAGWYGGLGVELMSMARPVVCYVRDEDLTVLPERMRRELPVLRADPRRLTEDLAWILDRRAEWSDMGAASREYVLRWHNPRRIARAMVEAYRDRASTFDLEPYVE
jgi:hypothetical protein